jgi:hypothetical protein
LIKNIHGDASIYLIYSVLGKFSSKTEKNKQGLLRTVFTNILMFIQLEICLEADSLDRQQLDSLSALLRNLTNTKVPKILKHATDSF